MRHSGNSPYPQSGHRSSHAAQSAVYPFASASATVAPPRLSSRNLDLCLLAVCSCVLTVLCHQTIPVSFNAAQTSTASAMTASSASPSQIAFTLKAGFFTTSQKDGTEARVQQEED